jgi:hypothetical protein
MTERYPFVGHRLRVTRLVLGITEQQAADAAKITIRTWQKSDTIGTLQIRCWGAAASPRDHAMIMLRMSLLICASTQLLRARLLRGFFCVNITTIIPGRMSALSIHRTGAEPHCPPSAP